MFQNATNTSRRSSCGTMQKIRWCAWSSSYWSPEERGWNPWQQRAAGRGNPHTSQYELSLHLLFFIYWRVLRAAKKRYENGLSANTPGLITGLPELSRTGTFVCAANQQRPGHVTTQAPPTVSACTEAHVWQGFKCVCRPNKKKKIHWTYFKILSCIKIWPTGR